VIRSAWEGPRPSTTSDMIPLTSSADLSSRSGSPPTKPYRSSTSLIAPGSSTSSSSIENSANDTPCIGDGSAGTTDDTEPGPNLFAITAKNPCL
jgi:hypothetical protein